MMPRGNQRLPLEEWLQQPRPICACGCGGRIELKLKHRYGVIPRFLLGHRARLPTRRAARLAEWLSKEQALAPMCACGCGERIIVKPFHRRLGLPRFITGHHVRAGLGNNKGIGSWVAQNRNQHLCACGCGKFISVRPAHFVSGIPLFRHHHRGRRVRTVAEGHPRYVHDRVNMTPRAAARPFTYTKLAVAEAFDWRCAWCGARELIEFDHVVPVAHGGLGDLENIHPLCPTCHRWKSGITLTLDELRRPPREPRVRTIHAHSR